MKMPKLPKLPKFALPNRLKKLRASTAAARRAPVADDYYEDEPKTNLSSAFVVVLILHVVAVGGIYTFNSIRAARRGQEIPAARTVAAENPALQKTPADPVAERTVPVVAQPAGKGALKTAVAATPSLAKASPVTSVRPTETAAAPNTGAALKTSGKTYTVAKGDTPISIARKLGTSSEELLKLNKIDDPKKLQPGQTLKVPAKKTN